MNIFTVCGFAILGVTMLMFLKQLKSNYIIPLTVILCLLLSKQALQSIWGEIDFFGGLLKNTFSGETGSILLKVFGISFTTEAASDVCRDAGESAIAVKLETVGKAEILLVTIPLINKIIEIIKDIML